MADDKMLHIYGQSTNHASAYLIANPEALRQLLTQIQAALDGDCSISSRYFVNDGEGFDLEILCLHDEGKMRALMDPYMDSIGEDGIPPYTLCRHSRRP